MRFCQHREEPGKTRTPFVALTNSGLTSCRCRSRKHRTKAEQDGHGNLVVLIENTNTLEVMNVLALKTKFDGLIRYAVGGNDSEALSRSDDVKKSLNVYATVPNILLWSLCVVRHVDLQTLPLFSTYVRHRLQVDSGAVRLCLPEDAFFLALFPLDFVPFRSRLITYQLQSHSVA